MSLKRMVVPVGTRKAYILIFFGSCKNPRFFSEPPHIQLIHLFELLLNNIINNSKMKSLYSKYKLFVDTMEMHAYDL